jgi:hypothetical protein
MSSPVCAVAELILKHSTSTTAANLLIFLSNRLIVGRERNFSARVAAAVGGGLAQRPSSGLSL